MLHLLKFYFVIQRSRILTELKVTSYCQDRLLLTESMQNKLRHQLPLAHIYFHAEYTKQTKAIGQMLLLLYTFTQSTQNKLRHLLPLGQTYFHTEYAKWIKVIVTIRTDLLGHCYKCQTNQTAAMIRYLAVETVECPSMEQLLMSPTDSLDLTNLEGVTTLSGS